MGKRARRRGERGAGTRQRYKERALGLQIAGVSKPMLDAMNEVSLARYGVGIGVLVQEEEREQKIAASLERELKHEVPRWHLRRRRARRRALRDAREMAQVWTDRLNSVSSQVAAQADSREVERFATRR